MRRTVSILIVIMLFLGLLSSCGDKKEPDENHTAVEQQEEAFSGNAKIVEIALTDAKEYVVGVSKDNTALLQQVNEYLSAIKADGTLDDMILRAYGTKEKVYVSSAEEGERGKQLVVATNAENRCFSREEADEYTGIDVEIAKGLASAMNKELVIKKADADSFSSLIESGDADLILSCLTADPSRNDTIAYSAPYYSAEQVLIIPVSNTDYDACASAEDVEQKLNELKTSNRIGVQKYTTAQDYVEGNEDLGFEGFQAECVPYPNCRYALENLLNGDVDLVITDKTAAETLLNEIKTPG